MYVRVNAAIGALWLAEPDDCTRFHLTLDGGRQGARSAEALDHLLTCAGVGSTAGGCAFVPIAWVQQVLVITSGVPGCFVAHADLDDLVAFGDGKRGSGDPTAWFRALNWLESMPQPVVAAVTGQAWGGGLALARTLRVLARSATIARPR